MEPRWYVPDHVVFGSALDLSADYINHSVPVYDSTGPFRLANYTKLPQLKQEILNNSAVVVVFSLGAYTNKSGATFSVYKVDTCMSLNVQSVILLAKPTFHMGNLPTALIVDVNHPGVASATESEEENTDDDHDIKNADDDFFL